MDDEDQVPPAKIDPYERYLISDIRFNLTGRQLTLWVARSSASGKFYMKPETQVILLKAPNVKAIYNRSKRIEGLGFFKPEGAMYGQRVY